MHAQEFFVPLHMSYACTLHVQRPQATLLDIQECKWSPITAKLPSKSFDILFKLLLEAGRRRSSCPPTFVHT